MAAPAGSGNGQPDAAASKGTEPLSAAQVAKLAKLARLSPDAAQLERYRHDLAAVLHYVERLGELKLDGVEPMYSPLEVDAPLRADVPEAGLPNAALMAMAPQSVPPFVKVPKVIGESQ
jgi:aspartyl-tRNA(Asn)/glutamyl-tRNA(Gln) amidotransferase subunit C